MGILLTPNDYRPVTLISVILEVFVAVIFDHLRAFLKCDLLSDRQYGFHSRRSTGNLVAVISHYWPETLDKHRETNLISMDPQHLRSVEIVFVRVP